MPRSRSAIGGGYTTTSAPCMRSRSPTDWRLPWEQHLVEAAAGQLPHGGRGEFDIIVYGATGFVGRLTAQYLAGTAPAGARTAVAGRSEPKLRAVQTGNWVRRAGLAGGARRRDRRAVTPADGGTNCGGGDHRGSVREVRPAVGGGVRPSGDGLRRPHRRAAVRPREHRPLPRTGAAQRGANRALLRLRFRSVGSQGVSAVPPCPGRRRRRARRHYPGRGDARRDERRHDRLRPRPDGGDRVRRLAG